MIEFLTKEEAPLPEDIEKKLYTSNSHENIEIYRYLLGLFSICYPYQNFHSFINNIKQDEKIQEMFNYIKEKAMHPVLRARLSFINLQGKDYPIILSLYSEYFEWLKTQNISNFLSLELDIALGTEVLILSKQYINNMTIHYFALYAAEQMLEKPTADFRAVFPVKAVLQTDKKGVLGKEYYTKVLAHYENVLEQFDETNKGKFMIYDGLLECAKRLRNSSLEADILERKKKFYGNNMIKQETKYFLIIY